MSNVNTILGDQSKVDKVLNTLEDLLSIKGSYNKGEKINKALTK